MIRVRTYGDAGPRVVLLHGGPGAAGYMAPVARGLADSFRVLEPFQRRSGGGRLTVAHHIADLHEVIETLSPGERPALVGSSWGAMLAMIYAAAHPMSAGSLVLIGCGTFDPQSRARFRETLEQRTTAEIRRRMDRLPIEYPDSDERLRAMGDLLLPIYSYDLATTDLEVEVCDARGHHETWQDFRRLEQEGVYPAAFSAIRAPVLMLHGTADPHPGHMIRDCLLSYLPQLEYREWERCGHYPWLESGVRDEFFSTLRAWLAAQGTIRT